MFQKDSLHPGSQPHGVRFESVAASMLMTWSVCTVLMIIVIRPLYFQARSSSSL